MRSQAAVFIAVAVLGTAVASYFAFLPVRAGSAVFWALAGGPTVVLAGVAAVWAKREELLREWLSPRWGDFSRGVVGAVLLFGAAWGFARVVDARWGRAARSGWCRSTVSSAIRGSLQAPAPRWRRPSAWRRWRRSSCGAGR